MKGGGIKICDQQGSPNEEEHLRNGMNRDRQQNRQTMGSGPQPGSPNEEVGLRCCPQW